MKIYCIKLKELPHILFACRADIRNYRNEFRCPKNFLEISYIEEGNIICRHADGSAEIRSPGMLCCVFSDHNYETLSQNGERQKHVTVAVRAAYGFETIDSESCIDIASLKERLQKEDLFLIPGCMMLHQQENRVPHLIKKIISHYHSANSGSYARALAEWFSLAAYLTEITLREIDDSNHAISPSEEQYTNKAMQYIHENYTRKITVRDIAEALSLSEGYLHRIFKKSHNMTILEYVSRYRIGVAIDLIQNRNMSLAEAAAGVGIDDPAYMSRLFKKITGLCCRDYFKQITVTTEIL